MKVKNQFKHPSTFFGYNTKNPIEKPGLFILFIKKKIWLYARNPIEKSGHFYDDDDYYYYYYYFENLH
jgi:hypothetical protein